METAQKASKVLRETLVNAAQAVEWVLLRLPSFKPDKLMYIFALHDRRQEQKALHDTELEAHTVGAIIQQARL